VLTVSDPTELLALHRALMEAKFNDAPNAPEVQASPYVAAVSHRTLDALIAAEEARGNHRSADGWREWRAGDAHDWLRRFVLARLADYPRLTEAQRRESVRLLAAPLVVTDAWVDAVVAASLAG
jgi:hypothetical protein